MPVVTRRVSAAARVLRHAGYRGGNLIRRIAPAAAGIAAGGLLKGIAHQAGVNVMSSTSPASVVSTQNDVVSRYRKKRASRSAVKRVKRGKRFQARVQGALMRMSPLRTYTADNATFTSYAVDTQGLLSIMMAPINIVSVTYNPTQNDIQQCFYDCYGIATVAAMEKARMLLRSSCLDVQITNTGSSGCILDVYTVVLRKSTASTAGAADFYTTTFNEMTTITASSPVNPAVTLFQNPNFCAYYKILAKKEVNLGVGQVITMQLKGGKRFVDGKMIDSSAVGIPGYTKGYFFMPRGIPEYNAGVPRLTSGQISVAYQRTYSYAAVPSSITSEGTHQS